MYMHTLNSTHIPCITIGLFPVLLWVPATLSISSRMAWESVHSPSSLQLLSWNWVTFCCWFCCKEEERVLGREECKEGGCSVAPVHTYTVHYTKPAYSDSNTHLHLVYQTKGSLCEFAWFNTASCDNKLPMRDTPFLWPVLATHLLQHNHDTCV